METRVRDALQRIINQQTRDNKNHRDAFLELEKQIRKIGQQINGNQSMVAMVNDTRLSDGGGPMSYSNKKLNSSLNRSSVVATGLYGASPQNLGDAIGIQGKKLKFPKFENTIGRNQQKIGEGSSYTSNKLPRVG